MPYIMKINEDITFINVDVIVNSLGIKGDVYGSLCEDIIKYSFSSELKEYIDSLTNNKIGTIYETKGYYLPCKEIFHVVTPYKKDDDENLTLLKKTYLEVIDKAIQKGYKSISLPLIGTGANGYSESEAYDAVMDAVGEILYLEEKEDREIITMNIVFYFKSGVAKTRVMKNECSCNSLGLGTSTKKTNYSSRMDKINRLMKQVNSNEFLFTNRQYTRPFDFVLEYCDKTGISDKDISKRGIGRRRKYRYINADKLQKIDVLILLITFNLSITLSIQFLNLCGYSFTPFNDVDMFVVDYLLGYHKNIKTKYDLYKESYDACGKILCFDDID